MKKNYTLCLFRNYNQGNRKYKPKTKAMKTKISHTVDSVKEAIKQGYKFVVEFADTNSLYACDEVNNDVLSEIYEDNGHTYNQYQQPEKDKHFGCPIDEAIELFELS